MAAFRATFSDLKLIKTRQVAQLIFEIPLEQFDPAYEVLGGVPIPGKERWFGIAAINAPMLGNELPAPLQEVRKPQPVSDKPPAGAKREKKDWRDMPPSQQAAIRCGDAIFQKFLEEQYTEDWRALEGDAPEVVRYLCGVKSRSELNDNHPSRVIWHQLDSEFVAWKTVEHA